MFRLLSVAAALALPLWPQRVTASADVTLDGRLEHVRKINARWWSDDNREMFPPTEKSGFLWTVEEKSPYRIFYHHKPVDLVRVEALELFETPDSVNELLGDPNAVAEIARNRSEIWSYYAADGTEVRIRFFQNELTDAMYHRVDGPPQGKMVGSIERELNGRTVLQVLAERAGGHHTDRRRKSADPHPRARLKPPASTPDPAPAPRLVSRDALEKITPGMTRADVIARLGEPLSSMRISGSDPPVEVLRYPSESEGEASVRFEDGKVVRVMR